MIDINYNNEILLNNNKIIFKNDKIIFNEEYDVIIINILNYNIYKPYFENIDESSIIIYDNINRIDEEKIKLKNNIYIIGEYITLNTSKNVFYIPTEIEQMLNCYNINKNANANANANAKTNTNAQINTQTNINTIIDTNFINKCIENNNNNYYIKNIFAKSLLLSIVVGNNTFQYFKKKFEEKNYIEIIKISLQISKIIDDLDKEDNIYNDHITNSIIISSNNRIPYDIAKLYDVLITYKIFYQDRISSINGYIYDYIYDYIPDIYINMKIKYEDLLNNLVNENKLLNINKLNFVLIEKPGNTKIIYRNFEDIKDYIKYGFNEYF
jgi:hypothetical protein